MYELWLALNVMFELARMHWPVVAALALVWLVLVVLRLALRGARGVPSTAALALIWLVATVVTVLGFPALTRSSLGNVAYLVDWLNLIAIGVGVGLAIAAFAWPIIGLASGRHRRT